jgi:hypothetical protein
MSPRWGLTARDKIHQCYFMHILLAYLDSEICIKKSLYSFLLPGMAFWLIPLSFYYSSGGAAFL